MVGESSVAIPFTVVADHESNLTFHITYENGDVDHSTEVVLPVKFENDKTAAVPVVNNIVLVSKGTYYELTGDITNTGITDAKGLVVTVGFHRQKVPVHIPSMQLEALLPMIQEVST